jgi:hypothetical protein
MKYPDGNEVRLRDLIWENEGTGLALVHSVVETGDEYKKWGLNEPGIFVSFDMSRNAFTANMFVSQQSFADEAIRLLTEEETSEVRKLFPILCQFDPEVSSWSYTVRRQSSRGCGWIIASTPSYEAENNPESWRYYCISESGEVTRLAKG